LAPLPGDQAFDEPNKGRILKGEEGDQKSRISSNHSLKGLCWLKFQPEDFQRVI